MTRLDIRTKLLGATALLVWTLAFNHPLVQLGLTGILLALAAGARLGIGRILSRLAPLAPLLLLICLFTGFTGAQGFVNPENQTELWHWGSLTLTRGGLLLGGSFILRLINMVVLTLVLLAATPLDDFILLFVKLRLSRTLSFIITTAIRFVPELDRKRQLILTAQKARGLDSETGNLWQRLRARMAVMVPLMVNAILLADQLSLALMNRGFGYDSQWTALSSLRARKRDFLVGFLALAGAGLGIYLTLTGYWGKI